MTKIVASRVTHTRKSRQLAFNEGLPFGLVGILHFQLRWTLLGEDMMANLRTFLGVWDFCTKFAAFEHFFGLSSLSKGVFSSTELFPYSMQHITTAIFLVILRNSVFPADKPNLPRRPSFSKPRNHQTTRLFSLFQQIASQFRTFQTSPELFLHAKKNNFTSHSR